MSADEIAATPEPAPEPPPGGPRPAGVTLAAGGALLEALALTGSAGLWLVQLVQDGSSAPGVAVFLILFAVGLAAALVAAASAVRRGGRRARGPLITWQLLQVATAFAVVQVPGRPGWLAGVAVVAMALAAAVVAALLTPKAVAFATR